MTTLNNKDSIDEAINYFENPQCLKITKCLPCSKDQESASFCRLTKYYQRVQCTFETNPTSIACTLNDEKSDQLNYFYFQTTSLILTAFFLFLVIWRRSKIRNEHYKKLLNQIDNV
jgi:hypothetical protein